MQSHIRKVNACLAVTCHLHFWQDDRDLLRATAVTRGWNGYQNRSQHRKLTLEKKILPLPPQGFEPTTFQSRVRHSNHWAIPGTQCRYTYSTHITVLSGQQIFFYRQCLRSPAVVFTEGTVLVTSTYVPFWLSSHSRSWSSEHFLTSRIVGAHVVQIWQTGWLGSDLLTNCSFSIHFSHFVLWVWLPEHQIRLHTFRKSTIKGVN